MNEGGLRPNQLQIYIRWYDTMEVYMDFNIKHAISHSIVFFFKEKTRDTYKVQIVRFE